jgi:diketogulonate reductase-like aldo/keto reductase
MKESNTPRNAIWVTTKLWPQGRGRAAAIAACEDSLRRLGLDYVDLYLIHSPKERRLRGEQWLALEGELRPHLDADARCNCLLLMCCNETLRAACPR